MAYLNLAKPIALLQRTEAVLNTPAPILKEVAEFIKRGGQESFVKSASPEGSPWPMLSPRTIRDRAREGYGPTPILVRSGDLARSLGVLMNSSTHASIGSDLIYAAVHQLGRRGMPEIPQRSYLGIPPGLPKLLSRLIEKALAV